MSVPAPPSQHGSAKPPRAVPVVPLAVLLVGAAAAGAAVAMAPASARTWTVVTALVAWLLTALGVLSSALLLRRSGRSTTALTAEVAQLKAQLSQQSAEAAHLGNVTLPAVAKRLREGAGAGEALAGTPTPSEPQLRLIVNAFASALEQDVRHAAALDAERQQVRRELDAGAAELERLTTDTLPAAVTMLRAGNSADTVLAELDWPRLALLYRPAESFVRELAQSERRAAAAQAASAKALSRVQAKAVSMLADLRDMQERHGEEVFGDLLKLDHSTSQLGLMTDRLALLMGGRASRAWNKPIVMESILRGAVGRIAAYQRVRLHCPTSAAISGFAAEGVMHLLAELMDNAANFSPPIDEVHVYVEERSAGIVVTIEDSGLKMADAAMRRAEEAVTGRMTDLATLQGTRLGLAVVGRLAVKYGISVNYRPSSRGGTGVVVLLPLQLLAQQREPAPQTVRPVGSTAATAAAAPAAVSGSAAQPSATVPPPAAQAPVPEPETHQRAAGATPNGLPVRAPGRTMAEAEQERQQRRARADAPARDEDQAGGRPAPRNAGASFGAFHRGRQSAAGTAGSGGRSEDEPPPTA